MEPSKTLECKEECSSSVSGWTMYLGSPDNENDSYDNDDDDDCNTYEQGRTCRRKDHCNHDEDDVDDANNKSDDSMASDASSGPSHQELPQRSGKLSLDRHTTNTHSWKQRLDKHKTRRDEGRIKVERDKHPLLIAKDTASQAQSEAKVKKSKQMGK